MILKSGFVKVHPRQPEITESVRRAGGKKSNVLLRDNASRKDPMSVRRAGAKKQCFVARATPSD
jgi:hypothetical protein